MFILARKNGAMNRTVHEYYADTKEDMNTIPQEEVPMGSTCYIISTGETFMADSAKIWQPYSVGGGGGITIQQLEEALKPYVYLEESESP